MPRPPALAPAGRSPYWTVGMSSAEPWTVVGQTNLGLVIVPCNVNGLHAVEVCEHWRLLTAAGYPVGRTSGAMAVGAAVVDPAGEVTASWGQVPTPGGASRWAPIMRLKEREPAMCLNCRSLRWQGCWVALDLYGCSRCLPAEEAADPRVWPVEPPEAEQARPVKVHKVPSAAGRRAGSTRRPVEDLVSPGQSRLL
jgi:hypothetical protein